MSQINNACPFYSCGKVLAEKLNTKDKDLSNYIYLYNKWAKQNGKLLIDDAELAKLDGKKKEELLNTYALKLSHYMHSTMRLERIANAEDISQWEEALGSSAVAAQAIVSRMFSASERLSFKNELVYLLRQLASVNKSKDARDFMSKHNLKNIFNKIKEEYEASLDIIEEELEEINEEFGEDINTYENDELKSHKKWLEKAKDEIERILGEVGPDGTRVGGAFPYLCRTNLSEFKKLFGKSFNPEDNTLFEESDEDNIHSEEEEAFDVEESVREHWTVILDSMDPTGSLSHIVNDIISKTPQMTLELKRVTDENGGFHYEEHYSVTRFTDCLVYGGNPALEEYEGRIPMKCDPRIEARKLIRLLSSCTSIDNMMERLISAKKYGPLVDELRKDVRLQTTFFEAFNKYYQHYYYTKNTGTSFSEIHLNGVGKNAKVSSFLYRFGSKAYAPSLDSIFYSQVRKEPTLNEATLSQFSKFFTSQVGNSSDNFSAFYEKSIAQQNVIIEAILNYLDIPVNVDTAQLISSDSIALNTFLNETETLILKLQEKASQEKENKYKQRSGIEKLQILFQEPANGEQNILYTALSNILELVDMSNDFSNGFTGMVTYKSNNGNKNLTTNILMSHFTQFIKECNYNTPAQVRAMIKETFSADEAFWDSKNQRYRVRWIQDLYESAIQESNKSFRKKFKISRNLGFNETSFEDISDKGHMLSILSMYFNSISKGNEVVFINDENFESAQDLTQAVKSAVERQTGKPVKYGTYYYVNGSVKSYTFSSDLKRVDTPVRSRTCMVPTFITGDTLALRGVTALHYSEDEILEGMYDFFMMDIKTQAKAKMFLDKGLSVEGNDKENFTKNFNKFGYLKFLNPDYVVHIKEGNDWVEKKGYWYQKYMELGTATKDLLISKGDRDADGNLMPGEEDGLFVQYMNNQVQYMIEKDIPTLGMSEEIKAFKSLGIHDNLEDNLKDFYYNYKFSQFNQAAITNASPAFYINSKEQQKRNKGSLTNGQQLVMDARYPKTGEYVWNNPSNPIQRVVYMYDIKPALSSHDRTMLEKILGKDYVANSDYEGKSSLTDGQGWRSFSSWRKIGLSFGKDVWTDEMESAYWKIDSISKEIYSLENEIDNLGKTSALEDLSKKYRFEEQLKSKIQEIEDLAVIFQPRKPICDGLETYQGAVVPFQHKYSEIPIIPCLFPKGSAMRELGLFMESQNIDMICSSKCGKKGVFGHFDIQYKTNNSGQYIDSEGNIITGYDITGHIVSNPTRSEQRRNPKFKSLVVENRDESMKSILEKQFGINDTNPKAVNEEGGRVYRPVIHECPLKNYLIQSNVPDHVVAPTLFGTQIRKIILGSINPSSTYNYTIGGRKVALKGEQLITLFNAAISANFLNSYDNFENLMSDPTRLLKELSKNILSNDRCDLVTIDKVSAGIPYWDSSLQHDLFATLISMFKNSVLKQKIDGGNIVQASALGTDMKLKYLNDDLKFETDANGFPIKCEAIIPFNFSYTNEFGDVVQLKFEDYCNADGTFIMEGNETKIEKEFPGILDIVAYRIPTEAEYSCFHLKVKRCSPRSGANYIQLPTICTTRAGFDFDIDKLYLMRKTFDSSATEFHLKKVWDAIFEGEEEVRNALIKARELATKSDYDAIKEEYARKGLKEPKKDDDIPLNRFWKVAEQHKLIPQGIDKNTLFRQYARRNPEYIKRNKFNTLTPFNEDSSIALEKIFDGRVSKSELDNILMDIILERLSDPETAKARFTAGGFADASSDAKLIRILKEKPSSEGTLVEGIHSLSLDSYTDRRKVDKMEDPEPDYDFSDPMTAVIYNRLNQKAARLIGIYANDSSNYNIFANIKSMKLTGTPIVFGSMINSDIPEGGVNMLVKESLGKTTKQKLAELLAAAVDAVKDPVLNYLNLDSVTGEAATVLIRMGYDTVDVGLLFNQPIIAETLTLMQREGVSNTTVAINQVLANHGVTKTIQDLTNTNKGGRKSALPEYVTREALAYNITKGALKDPIEYKSSQLEVARIFYNLMKVKDEFSSIVQQTRNTSSNVVKSNFGEHMARKARIESYVSSDKLIEVVINNNQKNIIVEDNASIATSKDKLEYFKKYNDHPFAFENIVYNLINKAFGKMIRDNTPFESRTFKGIFDTAKTWCSYGTLSADSYNGIMEDMSHIILSKLNGDFNPNAVNPDRSINPEGLSNAELYLTRMDDMFRKISLEDQEEIRSSFIGDTRIVTAKEITSDDIEGTTVKTYTQYILRPNYNLTKEQKSEISASWDMLMDSESKDVVNYAKAMFLHFYYSHGFKPSSNFNPNFVPASVLTSVMADYNTSGGLTYSEFMDDMIYEDDTENDARNVMDKLGLSPSELLAEWILQHTDNKQFVYTVTKSVESKFVELEDKNSFMVSTKDSYMLTHNVGDRIYATPFVIKDGVIYMLKGFQMGANKIDSCLVGSKSKPLTYVAMDSRVLPRYAKFVNKNNGYLFGDIDIKSNFDSLTESYTSEEIDEPDAPNSFQEALTRNQKKPDNFCK